MAGCCEDKSCEISALRANHGRVLWIVLALNATMFIVELVAGLRAHSTSLLADSLDMLGDAVVYAFSLFVLARSARWQAGAALVKGIFMLLFGLGVLAEAASKAIHPVMPDTATMGVIGVLALCANLACFLLLYRHRGDNLNMSSTWLCSRNDLIANVGVLLAAAASSYLASRWPDLVVGVVIAGLFLESAFGVLKQSLRELRASGIVQEAKDVDYELVAKPELLQLYLRDHGKPRGVTGVGAKVTLLNGSEKQEVMLAEAGDRLEAKGAFKVGADTKALATVTLPGKPAVAVRFALK